ncbi:signal peptidase I [Leucobacter komagatae]|uniref:signal peptidase I n=1 Tax=Leucobacter komagatae TaxID=55969 RepID=UPI000A01DE90|nr:signal peptidase I [Leucobacter komagatae]
MTGVVSERMAANPGPDDEGEAPTGAHPWPAWLRVLAGVRGTILTAAAALGVVSVVVFAGAMLFGLRPVVVISGSMEPELPVGSVALIKPVAYEEVEVGDVVTVPRPRGLGLVTHRVVELATVDGRPALELKGDANRVNDPQPYVTDDIRRMVFHVPRLGFVTLFLQEARGLIAVGGIVIALFAVYLLDPRKIVRGDEVPG